MTAQDPHDPLVRIEAVALSSCHSGRQINRLAVLKRMPPYDAYIPNGRHKPALGWRISTLRAWNPAIADRCAAIMDALENLPKTAA